MIVRKEDGEPSSRRTTGDPPSPTIRGMISRRIVLGLTLTLLLVAAAVGAVLWLAEVSSFANDPDTGELAVQFTLAMAVSLGWAVGGAIEGWIRGDSGDVWFEALFYRVVAGGLPLFAIIAAAMIGLDRLGVGPGGI